MQIWPTDGKIDILISTRLLVVTLHLNIPPVNREWLIKCDRSDLNRTYVDYVGFNTVNGEKLSYSQAVQAGPAVWL